MGQPTLRSVDSECQGPAIELRKFPCVSLRRSPHGGHAACTARVRSAPSHRSRRTRHRHNRGFPGTWERLVSPRDQVGFWEWPNTKDSWPAVVALGHGGSELQGAPRGSAKRRKRSAAQRTAASRSALIVPEKGGNGTARTAWREARRRIMEPLLGRQRMHRNSSTVSTKQQRVASVASP